LRGYDQGSAATGGESDNNSDGNDDEGNDDDFDDLDDEPENMETDKSLGKNSASKTPEAKKMDMIYSGGKTVGSIESLGTEELQSQDVMSHLFTDVGERKAGRDRVVDPQRDMESYQGLEEL
jgi:hypothetical protein